MNRWFVRATVFLCNINYCVDKLEGSNYNVIGI